MKVLQDIHDKRVYVLTEEQYQALVEKCILQTDMKRSPALDKWMATYGKHEDKIRQQ